MKHAATFLIWASVIIHSSSCLDMQGNYESPTEVNVDTEARGRRDVIEEEKYYNIQGRDNLNEPTPWLPHPLPPEDPTTKVSIANEDQKVLPLYQTTERVTDKPTGRGARASNENWIKLPFPGHEDNQGDVLTPPQPSGDLINSRMPRVNFVTQNKQLETSESRNDKESIQRPSRNGEIRTEFVRPDEDDRAKFYKPIYPRQAIYYPEESRRYYDDRHPYFPTEELYSRPEPYNVYDRRRVYPGYGPRIDRYDESYDNYVPRKPKRIIYYAHLPEVVRTPPTADLRYRYDPYRRYEDDYSARTGRYDYRFRNRYPYAPLRKDDRYRDLAGAGTAVKDKKVEEKVTPTPVLPKREESYSTPSLNRNLINSHQYHDTVNYNDPISHKSYPDMVRPDDGYMRYEEPMFQPKY